MGVLSFCESCRELALELKALLVVPDQLEDVRANVEGVGGESEQDPVDEGGEGIEDARLAGAVFS